MHSLVSLLAVFLIHVTIHENIVKDLNQRDKGLGGTDPAMETSPTETKVTLGNWDSKLYALVKPIVMEESPIWVCF